MDFSNYEFDFDWTPISSYEIRNQSYERTETYSKEEILTARQVIINELERENLEQFKHELILMDRANRTETTMVVHAMVPDEENKYDGNESRNRTFYIQDGKIITIKKGKPKKSPNAPQSN